MTPEQEEKYEQLIRSICKESESASEVSDRLTEIANRVGYAKIAIIKAHLDVEEIEGKIIPYRSGHGSP